MNKLWSKMALRAAPYIPGEQLNKTDILKLNTNENPYAPSPKVTEAISAAIGADLRLYPSPTMDSLKESIADLHGLQSKNVFIGNGSDEVLAFAFMGFFNPGETIRFPDISYSFYPVYAKVFDIDYDLVPLQEDFTIKPEDYFNSAGGVIFPNPNAPTSLYLGLDAIEAIVQNNRGKIVIVDEAYIDFAPVSAVKLVEKYDNLLIIQTMSKSRSLAGLRVGFAIGHEGLIQALIRMKDSFNSYPIDRLALAGAEAAIKDVAYFNDTTAKINATRQSTTERLTALGFTVLPSAANFVFVTHEKFDAEKIYEGLRDKDVLIRYFNAARIDQYLRISIGTDDEMVRFFEELTEVMKG